MNLKKIKIWIILPWSNALEVTWLIMACKSLLVMKALTGCNMMCLLLVRVNDKCESVLRGAQYGGYIRCARYGRL